MISNISLINSIMRPARYWGGEWNSIKKDFERTPLRLALAYPDVYEIGMSNLAIPILYEIINRESDALAERVFAPWPDMESLLRKESVEIFSLESKRPLKDFDVIGFSLGYELTFTNLLNMLDLGHIPILSCERDDRHPLIIAGGSTVVNPEPLSDFVDIFIIGDGEEAVLDLLTLLRRYGRNRNRLLSGATGLPGFYVPSLYKVNYNTDGGVGSVKTVNDNVPPLIERRILDAMPAHPLRPVVPYLEVIHDRGAIEIQRGCSRGCRFCQAGIIYRPVRTRTPEAVIEAAEQIIDNCGYQEIALLSLSSGDYPDIASLVHRLHQRFTENNLTISLPSLRLDSSSPELIAALPRGRKATLTFAPEAGSERLRYAMNKDISDSLIIESLTKVFEKGYSLKLYFMVGLPTETEGDVVEIVNLVGRLNGLAQKIRSRPTQIKVNVSNFVPKPHTPCQWSAQDSEASLQSKYRILKQGLNRFNAHLSWHDPKLSQLEAVFSRGDRRLGPVIHDAWRNGCKMDAWREHFQFERWEKSFKNRSLDPHFYLRERGIGALQPWDHISSGVSQRFLANEVGLMNSGQLTANCQTDTCNACGLNEKSQLCNVRPESMQQNLI